MPMTRLEKIAEYDEQILQIRNRQKELRQQHNAQERKNRTRRLCQRMGLFESLLPGTIPLADDLFDTFLKKTILSESARKLLSELTAQNAAAIAQQPAEAAAQSATPPKAKPAAEAQGEDAGGSDDGGNGARVSG